ncbi:MAG TPA: PAS domain-containing protein [Acidimicrobiales bacterium]|nr:PAS domain-containing protein [Acidimicrobiales bacterium]
MDGPIEARLRAYLTCQSALGARALADTGADGFVEDALAILGEALHAAAWAVFVPRGSELEVAAGRGWLPHVQPRRIPRLRRIGPRATPLGDVPEVQTARLLRAHDLADGLVCDLALPRSEVGMLGVFGLSVADDAVRQLVTSAAEIIGAGLLQRDLADQVSAKERRLEEAQHLARLGSYDWDILADTNEWSDELYRIYGTEPGSFVASYDEFLARVHPDDRQKIMEVHRRAFESHEPYQTEERIVRPDGSVRILSTTGEVVIGDDGQPVRMRGICLDITDRVEADRQRDRMARAEDRRRQAFRINDDVVQGLTSIIWAIEGGFAAAALTTATDTLAAARSLVEQLLDGEPGEIDAELTRAEAAASPLRGSFDPPAAAVEPSIERVRIVLVDDCDDLRMLLRVHLQLTGRIEVVGEGRSGPEAVDVVARTQPAAVLLDLAMPGGNGLDAIPEIRQVSPGTRILMLSGFSREHLGRRALEAGADAYVEKGRLEAVTDALAELFPSLAPAR